MESSRSDLNDYGLVVVDNGYNILTLIKDSGGSFRREGVSDIIRAKSWITPCTDDAAAKDTAKVLKKRAKKAGYRAQTYASKVSDEHRAALTLEGLLVPDVPEHCVEIISSDDDNGSEDEEEYTTPMKKKPKTAHEQCPARTPNDSETDFSNADSQTSSVGSVFPPADPDDRVVDSGAYLADFNVSKAEANAALVEYWKLERKAVSDNRVG